MSARYLYALLPLSGGLVVSRQSFAAAGKRTMMTMVMVMMTTGRQGRPPPFKILELRAGLVEGESQAPEWGGGLPTFNLVI